MKLMEYLPEDYKKSPPVVELQNAEEEMWDELLDAIQDFEDQLFVETATWGLEKWEWIYDIETDLTKRFDIRRSAILAKKRGTGTTTVAKVKSVSEAYVGEVYIVEHNSEYYFSIHMVETLGVPENLKELKRSIGEIKPAHLDFEIVYKYNTYGDLEPYTYGEIMSWGVTYGEIPTMKLPEPGTMPEK